MHKKSNSSITLVILITILCALALAGCATYPDSLVDSKFLEEDSELYPDEEKNINRENSSIAVYDTDGTEITATESVIDMMEDDGDEKFLSAADLITQSDVLLDDSAEYYVYSKLNKEEQAVYNEIYAVIYEMQDDALLSTTDKDMIDHCFRCVLADHPEIFYVTGYSISKYLLGDEIKKITIKGCYTMDMQQVKEKRTLVDEYVNKVLSGINADASDYEKIKYVYEYLVSNNDYVLESDNNQNILSVVENGETVCQGYAKMTQLLLNKMGVFCTLVNGEAKGGITRDADGTIYDNTKVADAEDDENFSWGAHVWNIVRSDGSYYNVDTTWGDASFLYMDSDNSGYVDGPDLNYDYLLVPDSMISETHFAHPVVEMPSCDSLNDNYYVKEGLYFTGVDKSQIRAAFDNAYRNGDKYLTLKCDNADVYEEMKEHLFAREKVFDYLAGTSVRYVEYVNRNTLTIYL